MSVDQKDWSDDPRLLAYLLGELPDEQRAPIDAALAEGDEGLANELASLRAFLPELEGALAPASSQADSSLDSPVLSESARAAITAAAAKQLRTPRRTRQGALAKSLAAAVLVVGGVGIWQLRAMGHKDAGGRDFSVIANIEGDAAGYAASEQVDGWRPVIDVEFTGKMIIKKSFPRNGPSGKYAIDVLGGRDMQITRSLESIGYTGGSSDEAAVRAVVAGRISEARPDVAEKLKSMGYLFGIGYSESDVVIPPLEDNLFIDTGEDKLSTFSIDVDTASYTLTRSMIESGRYPRPASVRAEEFINYFSYDDAAPEAGAPHPMAVTAQVATAPWAKGHRLVRIGLAAERIEFEERAAANLVFLVDVSGSMSNANKLPLVIKALALLTESLSPEDRIAIVVYAGSEGLALDSTPIAAREAILQAFESLNAGGSTNGGAGIELAYKVARAHFVDEGVNRVILCTDGDFNVGATSDGALEELIATESAGGVDLTVLGFGRGNFQDQKMEKLSNRGNGNFAYIDSEREARKVLAREVAGTLVTVARDTKIQVEWNADLVQSFRQIGYENRQLEHADFANDAIDAGEMGAGHVVTALYEVVPQPGARLTGGVSIGEVRVRYKRPKRATSEILTVPILDEGVNFEDAPEALRFSAAAAAFAMILRGSAFVGDATLRDVRRWGIDAEGVDPGGLRAGFVELVEKAMKFEGR